VSPVSDAVEFEALIRRWFNHGWNQKDTSVIPEIFAVDYLAEGGAAKQLGAIEGHAGLIAYHTRFHAAVKDLHFEIIALHVCGDIAMVEYQVTGVFQSALKGHEEVGDLLDITAVDVFRFEAGRIAQRMVAYEQA